MRTAITQPRERGAALLLAFLAVLVLVVVVGQLAVSSSVDRSIAINSLDEIRYDYAARGAFHVARSLLIKDSKDEGAEDDPESEGADDPVGDPTADPTGDSAIAGAGGGEDAATDSLSDEWADDQQTREEFGEVQVRIRIVDEDRKLNLLSMVAKDEDLAEAARERMLRLLDTFREDSKHDLSTGDAKELVDGMVEWLQGTRDRDFPIPAQSTEPTSDDKLAWTESRFKDEPEHKVVYPLGLDELVMVEGMTEFLLRGFRDDERYVPGLEDVITVFSNVRLDPEALKDGDEEDDAPLDKSPFGPDADEPESEDEGEDPEEDVPVDEEDAENATETNQGRVNVNTAPLAVLRCLVDPNDLPYSVLEKVDEFRRNLFDEELVPQQDKKKKDDEDEEEDDIGFGDDEEQEEDFVFKSTEEVIDRVEKWFETSFNVSDEAKQELSDLVTVRSHVFTIFLEARASKSGQVHSILDRRQETPPPDRVYRAVVWRRKLDGGGFQCVTLVPLHAWSGVVPPDSEEYRADFPFGF